MTYTVQVQSCNGAWRSGYSEPVKVTPRADKLPAAPDGLTLTGRYRRIEAHWKNMDDADNLQPVLPCAGGRRLHLC